MTRRKALTIALSVAGVSGLVFVLLLLSLKPEPVEAHASYAWKPGCHCGTPTTTTAKPTTTTTRRVTTTTTAKATTTTAKKASTTTATSVAKRSTTTQSTAGEASTTKAVTKKTKKSTTTTGDSDDDPDEARAIGASVASFPGGGDGSSGGSSGISGGEPVAAEVSGPTSYYFSPVAIALLAIYGMSFGLYRTRRMKVTTHRKIWNLLLLATFMLCGLIGLLLAVGITRSTPWQLPGWLLLWHVETGIAMCFISFFHIGWHARYYLAIVTSKRSAAQPQRLEAAGRTTGRERVSRPRPARPAPVRSAEERLLAFEQRRSARGEHTTADQPARPRTDAERWLEERRPVAPAS